MSVITQQPSHTIMKFHYGIEYRIPLPSDFSKKDKLLKKFPDLTYDHDRNMIILVNYEESKKMFYTRSYLLKNYYKYQKLSSEWRLKNICVPFYNKDLQLSSPARWILNDIAKLLGIEDSMNCGQWYEYFESRPDFRSMTALENEEQKTDITIMHKLENPIFQIKTNFWIILTKILHKSLFW